MEIVIDPKYIRFGSVGVLSIILLILIYFGFQAGKGRAQARLTIEQTSALMQGLYYFNADQDRYPTAAEFNDPQFFGVYVNNFPFVFAQSTACPTPIVYETLNQRTFTLSYCLPRVWGGSVAGLYELSERDIPAWLPQESE